MVRWGITGGIGAGKSVAGGILAARGIPVLDTDDVAREVVQPGTEGLAEVVQRFGHGVLREDGSLDRAALAAVVFHSDERRRELESILHPRIHATWSAWLERQQAMGTPLAAVVIPLLFEKGYAGDFHDVIAVGCTDLTQRIRLQARGWDDSQRDARVGSQWPTARKMAAADRVIWNEGTADVHARQWDRLLAARLGGGGGCQIGR
jgi:dephospho-CoA kinase